MNLNKNKQNRIKSLDGLKVIMLFLIFCWHTPENPSGVIGKPIVDIGARACEVLFVISGFLVGYNHYHNLIPTTLNHSLNYVFKKFAKIWPLHLICFLMVFIYQINNNPELFNNFNIFSVITNIFLLQAWTNNPYTFNGATWFLSALLFCYFMSPLLMSIFKKTNQIIITTFIGCIMIRILIELSGIDSFLLNYHTSPIIRCVEFYIGMLMVHAYFKLKEYISKSNTSLIMSLIELSVTLLYIFLIFKMEGKWIRGYFVLAACILVFVYTFNSGIISRILNIKVFSLFENIQMEFYILHQAVIIVFTSIISIVIKSVFIQSVILFFITVIFAIIYNRIFKNKLTRLIEKLLVID